MLLPKQTLISCFDIAFAFEKKGKKKYGGADGLRGGAGVFR